MMLRHRLSRLESRCPALPPHDPNGRRAWCHVVARWTGLLEPAASLLDPPASDGVVAAAAELMQDTGPYAPWLRHLRDGWSSLPALTPAVMAELMRAWLSPEADGSQVCRGCGLEYPRHRWPPLSQWRLLPGHTQGVGPPPWYDLPALFAACPHCAAAASEADWPHQAFEQHRPWMDRELCVPCHGAKRKVD